MAQYGKAEYWEERYQRDPEPFDWYQRWAGIKDIVSECVHQNQKILMVGAGNSRLSEEMYEDGYRDILNIDISAVVTKAMQEKYAEKPGLVYQQGNILDMKDIPDCSFDAVIDKGTMDSILCGEGSTHNVQAMLKEIARVLKPGGNYISISYGQPAYRLSYIQAVSGWTPRVVTVQKPMMGLTATAAGDEKDNVHYVYICHKSEGGANLVSAQ
eukprot:GDKI01020499.1.p1 GENE.GDKI01020499.1~~GDKI01020499.1.p1  ORF type:complete len:243 (-),score=71.17 GDKI01020499.1:267-905(-)